MATVVAVMDRPGWASDTDNIVIVDPDAERLLWVPRDLWCPRLHDRVNAAYARRGHDGLLAALGEHGFEVQHSICLSREAIEHALLGVEVTVPVETEQVCWYPLAPQQPIEDGRKVVRFCPPTETLRGERLHQWIGARHGIGQERSDFDRIANQQTLLRCLWGTLDFRRVVEHPEWVSVSDRDAYHEVRLAQATWGFATFTQVVARRIDGKAVLVDPRCVSRARRCSWWLKATVRSVRQHAGHAGRVSGPTAAVGPTR